MIFILIMSCFFNRTDAVISYNHSNNGQIEIKVVEREFDLLLEAYYRIDSSFINLPEKLSYYFVVEGKSRETNPNIFTSKSNFFNPYEANKPICVLRIDNRDILIMTLKIKNGSTILAKKKVIWERPKSLPISSNKSSDLKVSKANLSEIEIDGLIIDQTKTKAGRDFYELFYSNWVAPQQASDFTILITEEPGRGRSTLIAVTVNEQLVFKQFLQSRYEIIEQLMNGAVFAAAEKIQQLEEMKNQIEEGDQMGNGIF